MLREFPYTSEILALVRCFAGDQFFPTFEKTRVEVGRLAYARPIYPVHVVVR